jgi:RNase P subunit RPR2
MVQVIKRGVKQITCRQCQSVLEYHESEVKEEYRKDYDGGGDTYRSIDCPECKNEVYVK